MDFIFKGKPGQLDKWWTAWGVEMFHLGAKYGLSLTATRRNAADGTPGEWIITGPVSGVKSFRQLTASAARHIGFRGGDHGAVQFWLDHINGDHIMRRSRMPRKDDDRVQMVTKADGTKEGYRGRQRIG